MKLIVYGESPEEIADNLSKIADMLREGYVEGIDLPCNWELFSED